MNEILIAMLTSIKNELIDILWKVLPIAIPVYGAFSVIRLGIYYFKIMIENSEADPPSYD